MKRISLLAGTICFLLWLISPVLSQPENKLTKRLLTALETSQTDEPVIAWIFFKDKGEDLANRLRSIEANLTAHNYQRRLRNRGANNILDEYDIAVNPSYVEKIGAGVDHIRHQSRWLNAVSVEATALSLTQIAELAFVRKIDLVNVSKPVAPVSKGLDLPKLSSFLDVHTFSYGPSLTQNELINVPALHDLGYDGSGVLICMMDAGFNNLQHQALDHLDIVSARDFVNNDAIVEDEEGQMGNGNHGTYTLSVIAGFQEGQLIGPAYGASFLLAKTENTDFERHIEEDNWVAAAEWADEMGADIISSSLGYRDGFTHGETDYTSEDMDGQTAISSIAAEIAASRGMLVVNSAGNEGPAQPGENTIVAPSDGAHVLCVGAVTSLGNLASFSSEGPTADGRIKPDVMAMGQSVTVANPTASDAYSTLNGASFSCPLVAGSAALLLQAIPALTNEEIIEALRNTADNSTSPDNSFGWGLVDAVAAYNVASVAQNPLRIEEVKLYPAFPNPFNPSTIIQYDLSEDANVVLKIFNILGQEILTLVSEHQAVGRKAVSWDGRNEAGQKVNTGLYIYRLQAGGKVKSNKVLFLK